MNGMWIIRYLVICFGGWALIAGSFIVIKEWLKDEYPYYDYAEPLSVCYPKHPKPLPSNKQKFGIFIFYSIKALVVPICISLFITDGDRHRFIDPIIVMNCLMLPSIWQSIDSYFKKISEMRRDYRIYQDAGLLSEWRIKWQTYLYKVDLGDNDY